MSSPYIKRQQHKRRLWHRLFAVIGLVLLSSAIPTIFRWQQLRTDHLRVVMKPTLFNDLTTSEQTYLSTRLVAPKLSADSVVSMFHETGFSPDSHTYIIMQMPTDAFAQWVHELTGTELDQIIPTTNGVEGSEHLTIGLSSIWDMEERPVYWVEEQRIELALEDHQLLIIR